ncbi:MAG: hypothetical protein UT24_C0009G0075 [Candidatus Woesebacteria bacterium GW2011_GWB1_39_12]|uniref:SGNH hydrolase-type esterase domain-containing protein n=2 Tax=Candidatus Woeseibacteriota TaxID=1752722 RepID=A0A0G0ME21_9BACT|nr:MAG: hypothetical protein UT23_C0002G0075 [Candidatus Woesebacteria bacterium GW2011_GWA1_39_12]KKR00758.1 MAG: hypothetical protein UT24_C0009G0075 [Candidatus Woesebacteria bacterium GW2011_GWB1_39_12]
MDIQKKDVFIRLLSLSVLFLIFVASLSNVQRPQKVNPARGFNPTYTPTPIPFNPFPYKIPTIPYSRAYRTMLVGDSIVGSLGPNADRLRQHLIVFYPSHEFVNYNYGFGATSIETLPERLAENTVYRGQSYQPILSQGFDLIIVESFGYNPLSQLNEGEGLAKHMQILDENIKKIIIEKPHSVVAIMTPIAPNKSYFAKGVYDLSSEERIKWANERISYIEAVIVYAKDNEIPLINVYEKSLTAQDDGNLAYINPDDYVHPSAEGIELISRTIAEFIFSAKIFPE